MNEILIRAGGYSAAIRADMGANCISLKHAETGADILRTPASEDAFAENRNLYGMPFLFPPNRVRDGKYIYNGAVYEFPINEISRNNHIHGFLSATAFQIDYARADCAALSYRATRARPYLAFPHAFHAQIAYALSGAGLLQTLTVTNDSESPMPFGAGFHTTMNVPFIKGARAEDVELSVTCDKIYEVDARIIPTGNTASADNFRRGVNAAGAPISHLLSMRPGENRACLTDRARGVRVVYEVDARYRYWMLFNKGGDAGFICPEPQSWIVDAPNLGWHDDITGFYALKPGETRVLNSRIHIETL